MTNYDVVMKLIGPVDPVGETNTDNTRFDNLKAITELVDQLTTEIENVIYYNKESQMFSKKRAADFAIKFFDKLGIVE